MRALFWLALALGVFVVALCPAYAQSGDAIWTGTVLKGIQSEIASTGAALRLAVFVLGVPLWCLLAFAIWHVWRSRQ